MGKNVKKIFITGGFGFVGTKLTEKLASKGYQITLLDRSQRDVSLPKNVQCISGDATIPGDWQKSVAEHDIIINLAGESVFQKWTKDAKKLIYDSRILTTKNIVDALAKRKGKETHFFSTSAIGYYGLYHENTTLDENISKGDDFLADIAYKWEEEAKRAEKYGVRVVLCRFGIVLGKNGGALKQMIPTFKKFIGAQLSNGRQWFSWIHESDLADMFQFLLKHKKITGPINCTAPYPVTNKEFTKKLSTILHRPIIIPFIPRFVLKIVFGEMANSLIYGQKAIPKKLLDNGFRFDYPDIDRALYNLIKK